MNSGRWLSWETYAPLPVWTGRHGQMLSMMRWCKKPHPVALKKSKNYVRQFHLSWTFRPFFVPRKPSGRFRIPANVKLTKKTRDCEMSTSQVVATGLALHTRTWCFSWKIRTIRNGIVGGDGHSGNWAVRSTERPSLTWIWPWHTCPVQVMMMEVQTLCVVMKPISLT